MTLEKFTNHQESLVATLEQIEQRLNHVTLPIVVLSDFDLTLCNQFSFDSITNDHWPELSPELIAAAQNVDLIVATGRRAENPAVAHLWQCGLIPTEKSIITENGGVLVSNHQSGLIFEALVPSDRLHLLDELPDHLQNNLTNLPGDLQLVFKKGCTFLVTRLQDQDGKVDPINQQLLAEQIRELPISKLLQVVDTRASVTLQDHAVNKGSAFRALLSRQGIDRKDIFVVGMGDGENDAGIFAEADLRLGFSDTVSSIVDITIPGGADVTSTILKALASKRRA
jgi:HAD superfamily hydrolase (TIGR01484 family)